MVIWGQSLLLPEPISNETNSAYQQSSSRVTLVGPEAKFRAIMFTFLAEMINHSETSLSQAEHFFQLIQINILFVPQSKPFPLHSSKLTLGALNMPPGDLIKR